MQSSPHPSSPFASVMGLGAFQSEHRPSAVRRWTNLLFGFLLLAAGPVLILLAAYIYLDTYNSYGSLRANDSGFWLPLICGIAFIPGGMFAIFQAWRTWPLAVALYEGGFAHNDRKGLKQVRWDDIDAV